MMKLVVLISCMHQTDHSIINRSNVQTDAIVINQCDKDDVEEYDFLNRIGNNCHVKFISTKERGLSCSRNMAIKYAWGDVLYMCDDDELLDDNFEKIILDAYKNRPREDVIIFSIIRKGHSYPNTEGKVSLSQILRTSSVQTTFKRQRVVENNILFDEKMGSGTGNGAGEENKFLMDCRRKGLKMYYVPSIIATVKSENSQWFSGFDKKYFIDTFWAARRILGAPLGFFYLFYWCLYRSRHFKIEMSKLQMLKYSLTGFFERR